MSTSKAIAVFDISSSSVGGAHALIEQGSNHTNVTLLVQDRRDSGFEEELDIERFVNDTARTLETVIDHVRTGDVHHPDYIQVTLSSPWYTAVTRTITYSKSTAFSCTKRLVNSLVEKDIAALLKEYSATGNTFGSESKVAEQHIARCTLNGYETSNPYGKKVQSLELTLTVTLVPLIVIERFNSILRRSYGDRPIHVTTGVHAAFVALRDNGGIEEASVIIDLGEEVTDVAFVKHGVFISQHSFPLGTYELYRLLTTAKRNSIEARALIEGYRLKKLSASPMKTVEKAFQEFITHWMSGLTAVVEQGQQGFHLPATYYICADSRFTTVIADALIADPFLRHGTAGGHVRAFVADDLHLAAGVKTRGAEAPDAALALAALCSERV